jgi:hypothetical protein
MIVEKSITIACELAIYLMVNKRIVGIIYQHVMSIHHAPSVSRLWSWDAGEA